MNRRGFLLGAGGILASFAAPAIVRADSLMRIVPRDLVLDYDVVVDVGPIFKGEIGRYEGVKILSTPEIQRVFSAALFAATRAKPRFRAIFLHPSDYADLKGPQ